MVLAEVYSLATAALQWDCLVYASHARFCMSSEAACPHPASPPCLPHPAYIAVLLQWSPGCHAASHLVSIDPLSACCTIWHCKLERTFGEHGGVNLSSPLLAWVLKLARFITPTWRYDVVMPLVCSFPSAAGKLSQRGQCLCVHVQVRGKGLLNAIVIKEQGGVNAYDVCLKLKDAGLLVSC